MLGEFEYLLITAAVTLGENAYGVAMRESIAKATGRSCSIGALYTTLDRLEAKGLVKTWMGEGTPQRGGRSKRMVRVTPAGTAAARRFYDTMIRMSNRAPWAGGGRKGPNEKYCLEARRSHGSAINSPRARDHPRRSDRDA